MTFTESRNQVLTFIVVFTYFRKILMDNYTKYYEDTLFFFVQMMFELVKF